MSTIAQERVTADEVWEILGRGVTPLTPHTYGLADLLGRVIARAVRSKGEHPPFDRAVMDGYAVRAADCGEPAVRLHCVGLVRAGDEPPAPLEAGCCMRINTGAPLPPNADAVVIVEETREVDDGQVEVDDRPRPEQHIERAGAILRKGDLLVRGGVRVTAGTLAALAAGGLRSASAFPPPKVAVLSTGDEVVGPGRKLRPGQIYDSNSILLPELIRREGAEALVMDRAPDEPGPLRASVELGLQYDMLCVIGGMSAGTHDFVPRALEDLGVQWLVSGLHLKPGKPTRIGRAPNGAWVVGLPGNPVSCGVCFLLFARSILRGLQGLSAGRPAHAIGTLAADMPSTGARPMYHPAEWSLDTSGTARITPGLWRGSGDPFGLATANALIYRPAEAPAAPRGETVSFLPIDEPR